MDMMTMLVGDPFVGKSFLTMDIAARVTKGGPWPVSDERFEPGSVVVVANEEALGATSQVRFREAGGDDGLIIYLERVRDPETGHEGYWNLQRMDALTDACEKAAKRAPLRLVIVDPISGHMGRADSHKNAEVREALIPLCDFAQAYRVALVCISHMNKNESAKIVYRTVGSVGFVGVARMIWMVEKDPGDEHKRLLLPGGANFDVPHDRPIRALSYRLQEVTSCHPFKRKLGEKGAVLAYSDSPYDNPDELGAGPALVEAVDWLEAMLRGAAEGLDNAELREMAERDDIKARTLQRAKKKLNIQSVAHRVNGKTHWHWKLPDAVTDKDKFASHVEGANRVYKRSREGNVNVEGDPDGKRND